MHKILTTQLLDNLVSRGYRYCLLRTTSILGDDADTFITLVPVKEEPLLRSLLEKFDTYFRIEEEPRRMAKGIDAAIILVDFSEINTYSEIS